MSTLKELLTHVDDFVLSYPEYIKFFEDADFLDEVIKVLHSDDISFKKVFFLDNQPKITECIDNVKTLAKTLKDIEFKDEGQQSGYCDFQNVVCDFLFEFEKETDKFKKDLMGDINTGLTEKDFAITEDAIRNALVNNDSTKHMMDNLNNADKQEADENTKNIQRDMQKLVQQPTTNVNYNKHKVKSGYLITSQNMDMYQIIPGVDIDKNVLNRLIERSGIDNARVFKLVEIPTETKVIQKTVTVIK